MDFTYNSFKNLINTLLKNNFIFCDYTNYLKFYKSVIMRHDIDFSLEKALEIAKIESNMGVKSTFFLLITSNFYNVFSLEAEKIIREIISLNHKIGLHFDETRYDNNDFKSAFSFRLFDLKPLIGLDRFPQPHCSSGN